MFTHSAPVSANSTKGRETQKELLAILQERFPGHFELDRDVFVNFIDLKAKNGCVRRNKIIVIQPNYPSLNGFRAFTAHCRKSGGFFNTFEELCAYIESERK